MCALSVEHARSTKNWIFIVWSEGITWIAATWRRIIIYALSFFYSKMVASVHQYVNWEHMISEWPKLEKQKNQFWFAFEFSRSIPIDVIRQCQRKIRTRLRCVAMRYTRHREHTGAIKSHASSLLMENILRWSIHVDQYNSIDQSAEINAVK